MIVRAVPAGAAGTAVWMWCPGCEDLHRVHTGGSEGAQWQWDGDLERPTISPSILVRGVQWSQGDAFYRPGHAGVARGQQTACHSFVRAGVWEFLGDSTHQLAGQTVPVVPIPTDLFEEDQ